MHLIIGGAYQGKLDFAKKTFSLSDADVFTCREEDGKIDFSYPCISAIEEFALWCVHSGKDPVAAFEENRPMWQNSVLICRDIFCGVVPMDADMRAWRNAAGRLCQYLSKNADHVSRIFCGLEQRLK